MLKYIHNEIENFKKLKKSFCTPEETLRLEYLNCFEKSELKDEKQTLILDGEPDDGFLMMSIDRRLARVKEIGTEVYDVMWYEYNK